MDEVPPDVSSLGPHFTESPLFIAGVIALIILLAIFLRWFLFHNTTSEYKYKNED